MKLFRNPIKTAGIAGTGLIAAILFGASPSMAENDPFNYLDANGDGFISAEDSEYVTDLFNGENTGTNLKSADTNGDNRLSREEFAAVNALLVTFDTPTTYKDGTEIKSIFMISTEENGPSDLSQSATNIREVLANGDVEWLAEDEDLPDMSGEGRKFVFKTKTPSNPKEP